MNVFWIMSLGFFMLSAALFRDKPLHSIWLQLVACFAALAGHYIK